MNIIIKVMNGYTYMCICGSILSLSLFIIILLLLAISASSIVYTILDNYIIILSIAINYIMDNNLKVATISEIKWPINNAMIVSVYVVSRGVGQILVSCLYA